MALYGDWDEKDQADYDKYEADHTLIKGMVNIAVREAMKDKDGDYKDFAANVSQNLLDQLELIDDGSRKELSSIMERYSLLDGYNCPRSCLDGIDEIRQYGG